MGLKAVCRPLSESPYFSIRAVSSIPALMSAKISFALTVILAIGSPFVERSGGHDIMVDCQNGENSWAVVPKTALQCDRYWTP